MNDYEEHAIKMARDLAEERTARTLCRAILESVRELPPAERYQAADSLLHTLVLNEMLYYKERLVKQVESILRAAKDAVESVVSK